MNIKALLLGVTGLCLLGRLAVASQLTSAFTYQGHLSDGGLPANGHYDFQLAVYDALESGAQVGPTLTNTAVLVTNGVFTTIVNFGTNVFTGDARWLEIAVCTNGGGPFVTLSPRQPVQPTPYALYAPSAGVAGSAATADTANSAVAAGTAMTANSATAFTGALAGDVTGTQSATTVERLRGQTVAPTTPSAGQHLRYDGTQWQPGFVMLDQDTQGQLPLAHGGTGAATPEEARGNLHAAASGLNADITGLTGLAAPLSVGQGGTGSNTKNFVDLTTDQAIAGRKLFQPLTDAPGAVVRQSTVGAPTADVFAVQDAAGGTSFLRVDAGGTFHWTGVAQGDVSGQITGVFHGNGADLKNLNAGNLATGTLADARLSGTYSQNLNFISPLNQFTGNGQNLANLNAGNLATGTLPDPRLSGTYSSSVSFTSPANDFRGTFHGSGADLVNLDANNLASGTVPGGRLAGTYPNTVSFTSAGNNFQGTFQGNGANLTDLNAGNIASGMLNDARLSANIPRLNATAVFTATVSAPTMQASNLVADYSNANSGAISPGLTLGAGSGEGLISKRTSGGNQYGLDFFSAFTSRMGIANDGAIHFGPGTAFASYGDAQSSIYVLRGTSSGTGYGELFLTPSSQRLAVPPNSIWTFRIFVSGRSSSGKAGGYCFRGFIQNDGGTTWMREVANLEDQMEADSTWDVNVTANDSVDALVITARGGTGDSVRWVAVVYTCEVKW